MFYKPHKLGVLALFAILALVLLVGCKEPDNDPDDDPDDDPIVVDPTLSVVSNNFELDIDEQVTIVPIIGQTTESLTVEYSVADEDVCVVNNHVIKALSAGETTIVVSLTNYPTITTTISVTVLPFSLTLDGEDQVFVGETVTLTATDRNNVTNEVFWESLNPNFATVDQMGVVTGKAQGEAVIRISSFMSSDTLVKSITVVVPQPESIEINAKTPGPYKSFGSAVLEHQVLPIGANQEVVWSSSNTEYATIDATGKVSFIKPGQVEIIAKSSVKDTIIGVITMNIEVDPVALIKSLNVANPIVQYVTTYGNTELKQWVYGSVSKYFPGELNLKENIIAITPTVDGVPNAYIGLTYTSSIRSATEFKTVRSGVLKTQISDIIYHDTGNNNIGANADMHAKYIIGSANFETYKARSWHYTVDDKEAIQHLPDNEVGWQGDTELAYSTTIGIETCVDYGSDLYTTWHRTAKLMASLMQKHDLNITNIKQHYDFSQKNCPQTLRRNNLYPNAIELIKAEYAVLTQMAGYTITFQSNNPEYVNNYGRIINLPSSSTAITYTVRITNNSGYDATVVLISTLPAKTA